MLALVHVSDTSFALLHNGRKIYEVEDTTMEDAVGYITTNIIPHLHFLTDYEFIEPEIYQVIEPQTYQVIEPETYEVAEPENSSVFLVDYGSILYDFLNSQPDSKFCIFCHEESTDCYIDPIKKACKRCNVSSHISCMISYNNLKCPHCRQANLTA